MRNTAAVLLILFLVSCTSPSMKERALMNAVENNDNPEITRLVQKGADINAEFARGITPLIRAVELHNNDAAILLSRYGADFNHERKDGMSALSLAALDNDIKLIQKMLESSPPQNLTSENVLFLFMINMAGSPEQGKTEDTGLSESTADNTGGNTDIEKEIKRLDRRITSVMESKAVEEFLLREYLSGRQNTPAVQEQTGQEPSSEKPSIEEPDGRGSAGPEEDSTETLYKLSDLIGEE